MPNNHSPTSMSTLNIPLLVRAKLFIEDHTPRFLILSISIVVCFAAYVVWTNMAIQPPANPARTPSTPTQTLYDLFNNATFAGIFGAFVGAIGAGVFSF